MADADIFVTRSTTGHICIMKSIVSLNQVSAAAAKTGRLYATTFTHVRHTPTDAMSTNDRRTMRGCSKTPSERSDRAERSYLHRRVFGLK